MRLNKSTGHALRVMLACAEQSEHYVKAADLAKRLGLSLQNVLKIIHMLSRQGLIVAHRGRHGGVKLARDATSISVGDVVRALEMEPDDDGANDGAGRDLEPCVSTLLDDALLAFIAVLQKHSLADMLAMRTPVQASDRKSRVKAGSGKKVRRQKGNALRPEL